MLTYWMREWVTHYTVNISAESVIFAEVLHHELTV